MQTYSFNLMAMSDITTAEDAAANLLFDPRATSSVTFCPGIRFSYDFGGRLMEMGVIGDQLGIFRESGIFLAFAMQPFSQVAAVVGPDR